MDRTILIVDDSKTERVILTGFLKDKYNLIEAGSGEEAIEILREKWKMISAIVLDVVMPGMDGFETLRVIKSNALWLSIPVIITTGLDDDNSREKAIISGADNFVTKPFNQKLLTHVLDNAVRLREMAVYTYELMRDKLTGLLNRDSFFTEAERMIRRHEPGYYILSCMDIENFKVINDQYGTEIGDKVLCHIANTLSGFVVGINGLCGRYMADKFAIMYPAVAKDTKETEENHAEVIKPKCIKRPIRIRIGRYLVSDKALSVSVMFDRASMAEELVKGRFDTYIIDFNEKMRDDLLHEQQIVNSMTEALANGEFEPWFQPQYNHATGALIGAEALVRWRSEGKIIPPNQFIPVFEKNGFIYEVDQSVWRQVCAMLRRWLDEGKKPLPISVNISRYDLFQKDFIDVIGGLVKEYNLPTDLLRLEITESAFSETTAVIRDIAGKLINSGFTVEIDDFGSGYSSLNTLKDVPASIIKLDMRFFETTDNSDRGGNIVESVVRMAKWLGMAVIAEGVEEKEQADYLKSIGCYYIQGYYYSKPVPADEFERKMVEGTKEPKMSRLETIETLDSNLFWDPKSMETLIFNSYVGGACIFEFHNGKSEILRVNDQYIKELRGLVPAGTQLAQSSFVPFLDDDERSILKASLQTAKKEQKESYCELHLTDGKQVEYIRFTARVIAKTDERTLYYAVIVNTTDVHEAEQRAIYTSERIKAIMDNTQCGITAYVISSKGMAEQLFVNDRFYELMGYTAEQFCAEVRVPFDRIHPNDRKRAVGEMTKLQRVGQSHGMQIRAFRRDGSLIWLRVDIAIVRFASIQAPVQLSNFLDVTEQVEAEQKRNEAAKQLQVIMGNVNGSVSAFMMDDVGNTSLIFGNTKYYEIFGYTKKEAEAIQLDVMSCILPGDFEDVVAKLNQLKKDGVPVDIDYRARKKDGNMIYIRSVCSRMSMEGYGDEVIVAVETDITEQRTVQDQLRAIINNINGGVSVIHLRDNLPEFLLVNDTYFDIIGYTRAQFTAEVKNAFDIVHPDDRERVSRLFTKVGDEKKNYTMEYRIIRRNGAIRNLLVNTTVMNLFGVKEPVQLSVINDITSLREAERKERDASVQMQAIMQNIGGGVTATVYHDKNDVEVIFANDGFYALYGYTKKQADAEHLNILDLILPEDRERTMETVFRIIKSRGCETYEYRCRKRDGSIMWNRITNGIISLDGIGDTVLLGVSTDVTELRLSEQRNVATSDRLRAVMNSMVNGVSAVALRGERTEFLFANNRYYELHGITKDNAQNELAHSLALIYPDDRAHMRELITSTTEIGQTAAAEYRIIRPDKTMIWAKVTVSVTCLVDVDVPVQVAIYTDITVEKTAAEQLRFLNESAHDIIAQPDTETAINDTLQKLCSFFAAERTYVVEIDNKKHLSSNTYEVCASGIASQKAELQNLPFAPEDLWYDMLGKRGYMVIENVESYEYEANLRMMLTAQGIHSIIIVAMKCDGEIIGFAGVDNPSCAVNQVGQLVGIADYLSILLTRRDMKRRIEHDKEALTLLINDTPGGFLRMRISDRKRPIIESYNKGFCQLLGMTEAEAAAVCGEDIHGFLNMEDFAKIPADIVNAVKNKDQFTTKCRMRKKDGGMLWVMIFGRVVNDENSEQYINAYFTDITAEKKAEAQQIELLDKMPAGAALYEYNGKDLKVIHLNKRYRTLVGREPVEYGKTSPFGAIHPDDRALIAQEIESAIRQNREASADCRLLYGKDEYKPFHINAHIEKQDDGLYLFYVSYTPVSDDTMSIQEMLPIALSTMVESTEDMSYVKDKNLRYICVSQAVASMAGVENPRDFIGKSAEEMFDAAFSEKFNDDDRHVIETGEVVMRAPEHLPGADGSIILARTSKFPILDANGRAIGVYCVSRDITQQKEKESQLELLSASIPGGIAAYSVSDEGIKTLYFNDGYFAFSGFTRNEYLEMIGREPLALVSAEDRPKLIDMVHEFIEKKKDGMIGSCSYRCRTKDGGIRFMSMKAVLSQVSADAYIINAVQLDITDQVEITNRVKQLLDNLPFGAAMYEFDGKSLTAVHINKQFNKLVGRTYNATSEGYGPLDFIHPDDRKVAFDAVANAITDNRDGSCEIRLLCGDGSYHSFRTDARIVKNNDGKHLVYVAYSRVSEESFSLRSALPFIFTTIMESSTDLAFAKDINFRYICCSQSFAKLLGFDNADAIVGKTDYELFPKAMADRFRADDSRMLKTQKPRIDIHEKIPLRDGSLRYTRTSKHLLRDISGNIIGIYCVGRDVTEIREAYSQLKVLTDSIPGGIASFRCMPGNIEMTYYSDGVCALTGYTREEYTKNQFPPLSFIVEGDRPIIHRQIELLESGVTELDFTFRFNAKNGMKWINVVAHTTDHVGDNYDISAVLTDVTEAQREREELRLANEEYRVATQHAGRTICRYNIAEQSISVSEDVAKRLGLPKTITGVPYERVRLGKISEETKDSYIGFFEKIMSGEKECSATYRKSLPTGWRWIEARATVVFGTDGKPVSAIISYIDITDEREKEAIYSRWQNSLSERPESSYTLFRCNLSKSASFDSCEGKLLTAEFDSGVRSFDERTEEYLNQCVYADDRERYRAFLRADTMLAEYYRGHRSDSIEYREYLADGSTRWLKLTVDLVEYRDSTDIEAYMMYENIDEQKRAEQRIIERAETDPLTGVLNRATFAVKANRIMSESKPGTKHALLMIDIDGFKFVNDVFGHGAGDRTLCDIADLLTRSSEPNDLVGRLGGDEFIVLMRDIPNEEAAANRARKICELTRKDFSIDVRITSSVGIAVFPTDGEGFESLYNAADGVLYRVNDSGKNGYAFTHDDPVFDDDSPGAAKTAQGVTADKKLLRRLLIVDDNKIDTEILSALFKNEYRIETAADGMTALAKLRHFGTAISAVLLDLMMPGIDGFEVLRKLQQDENIRTIPVVVVSADEQRETALKVIRAGATDLVVKPIDSDVLHIRLESAISRAENERRRAQNSYLSLRNAEESSYKSALEHSGIMVITLDWVKNEFTYSPSVSACLAGEYDGRKLWRVLLSDMAADARMVEQMQRLVHEIAENRECTDKSMTVRLKTAEGVWKMFEMNVFKESDDAGNAGKILITFKETSSPAVKGE